MIWQVRKILKECLEEDTVGSMDSLEVELILKISWEDLEASVWGEEASVVNKADSNKADSKDQAKAKAKERTHSVSEAECQEEWDFNFEWLFLNFYAQSYCSNFICNLFILLSKKVPR